MYLILIFFTIHLISGAYNITIDAEEGTMKFTGRLNPNMYFIEDARKIWKTCRS